MNVNFYLMNKIAAVAGLAYLGQEFREIEHDITEIISRYRVDFSKDLSKYVSPEDVSISKRILERNIKLLDEFKNKIKSMVSNFIKSIERNHKKEIERHLGEDYETHLVNIISDPQSAYNPARGSYIKYKMIFQLLSGEDRDLLNRVTKYIEHEVGIFGLKFEKQLDEIEKLKNIDRQVDYNWINNYRNLFKFAQEEIELGDDDIEEITVESIGLKLRDNEKSSLKAMIELWKLYKDEFNNSKYAKILETKLDLIRKVTSGIIENEKSRAEMLESIFDRIRAIDKMLRSYIDDGNSEGEFFDKTGLTFSNAFSKLDIFVYTLSSMFPARTQVSKLINKMPRKFNPYDEPKPDKHEEEFFERGEQYEKGIHSGIEEPEKGEIIFDARDKKLPMHPRSVIPATLANYIETIYIIKKSSNKI